jgi:hypothetical protein
MTKNPAAPDTPPAAETVADPFDGLVPGRIVHYFPTAYQERSSCAGPWPAIVTRIESGPTPGIVTLNVNLPMVVPIGTDPVQRLEHVTYSAEKAGGCWTWMFAGQGVRYRSDPPSALPEMKA